MATGDAGSDLGLLGRIVEITGVASLSATIALVNNNARLGARVAQEYADLEPRR